LSVIVPLANSAPIQLASPSAGEPPLPGAVESVPANSQANSQSAVAGGLFSPSIQRRIDSMDRHLDDAGLPTSDDSYNDCCSCCC
jgi:hypothetical protein